MLIKIATEANEIIDNFFIREEVFIKEQNVPQELEFDGLDRNSTLVVGYLKSKPIACGRYRLVDNYVKVERVAILPEYRGKHYGQEIMEFIEEQIKENTPLKLLPVK